MKFAVAVKFSDDLSKLLEIRPAHREYLGKMRDDGKLALGGPFTDGPGGLLVYEAESQEQVEAFMAADPAVKGGIFASWTIHQWNPIFINRTLLPG